jgi:hypothetical protein
MRHFYNMAEMQTTVSTGLSIPKKLMEAIDRERGDRSIQEKDFGRIQKDRADEMKMWAAEMKKLPKDVVLGIVAVNNHYAGYGAGTAATFMQLLGIKSGLANQPSLADYGLG